MITVLIEVITQYVAHIFSPILATLFPVRVKIRRAQQGSDVFLRSWRGIPVVMNQFLSMHKAVRKGGLQCPFEDFGHMLLKNSLQL